MGRCCSGQLDRPRYPPVSGVSGKGDASYACVSDAVEQIRLIVRGRWSSVGHLDAPCRTSTGYHRLHNVRIDVKTQLGVPC